MIMGILEQITNMKKQGMPNENIISQLTQQGKSPREILDALKQAEIKNAVTGSLNEEYMQPSIMPEGEAPPQRPKEEQEQMYQPPAPEPEPMQEEYYQPQEQQYYQPQEQQYYQPQEQQYQEYSEPNSNPDLMMEVADQVVSEKTKKIQKTIDNHSEKIILLQNKFENSSERLKKIENIIDKMQIAILEKVGSYGQNLESVKKEMSMMQDSFSKMISSPRTKEESKKKRKK